MTAWVHVQQRQIRTRSPAVARILTVLVVSERVGSSVCSAGTVDSCSLLSLIKFMRSVAPIAVCFVFLIPSSSLPSSFSLHPLPVFLFFFVFFFFFLLLLFIFVVQYTC